jgi:hypothetical protein
MADIKSKYPSTDTVAVTITLASLSNDSTNKLAGQQSDINDNTTNVDLDHLLTGNIRMGTTPTSGNTVEVWAFAATKVVSGTSTYPDTLTGAGTAAKTLTSANVKNAALRLVTSFTVDATTGRDFPFAPVSIAQLFGGSLPTKWGVFVINASGVALDSTAGNHWVHYYRIQAQTV